MIESLIDIITNTIGLSVVDFACLVYIAKNLIYKPIVWFFKKYGGVIKDGTAK